MLILPMLALCLGGPLVLSACGDHDATSATSQGNQPTHRASHRAPGVKLCDSGPRVSTLPASLLGKHASMVPTQVLVPVNAWSAGDCRTETWVYAGAAGWLKGAGVFVISRSRGDSGRPQYRFIAVQDSGPLRITHAPLGPKVVTTAQRSGEFAFTSKRGTTGTLSLKDDTATLSTGEVIQATDRPYSPAG